MQNRVDKRFVSRSTNLARVLLIFTLIAGAGVLAQGDAAAEDVDSASGAQIADVSAVAAEPMGVLGYYTVEATLVATIDTSKFDPPSPDPAGIAYVSTAGRLLISDSEVNEMPIWADVNLFETTLSGNLVKVGNTTAFTMEPSGVAYSPNDGHVFIADDDENRIYEVDPGADGRIGTGDDTVTSFRTDVFGSDDATGVAYDSSADRLYVVDGIKQEVYEVAAGSGNMLSHFDVARLGLSDPEGIEFNPDIGTLLITDRNVRVIAETMTDGTVVRMIDITDAGADKPSGVAYAPGSTASSNMHLYIADRGVDNETNPSENDGMVYEMSIPQVTPGNDPPSVNAGPNRTITFPASATLNGTVSDDNTPKPPNLTTWWSQVSGPGAVSFSDASAEDTTASFTEPGTYVLRLTAFDGELAPSDEVTVQVNGTGPVADVQVVIGSDDAEERTPGGMSLTSKVLDLAYDADIDKDQTVGVRFNAVGIPQGATIDYAHIQFQVNKKGLGPVSLTIEGQDTNNAATFTNVWQNITSRTKTSASVSWTPGVWMLPGEAGPAQRTPDIGPIIQEIVNRPGWSYCNSLVVMFSGTGARVAESYDGRPEAAPMLHVYRSSAATGPNLAPCVWAGPDQSVTLFDGAVLAGAATDDGRPDPPGAVTTTWSKVSGPGRVTFGDASRASTTAAFYEAGTYVLRLTADDGARTTSDDITIDVTGDVVYLPMVNK